MRAVPPPVLKSVPERVSEIPLPRPHPAIAPQERPKLEPPKPEIARAPAGEGKAAAVAPPPAPSVAPKLALPPVAHNKSPVLPGSDSRTAVYDISARTVYMPNGDRLEAHSGLGEKMDNPRYVHVRMRGPTPPNVYELTLREQLFHGVRAIRLNPVDEKKMFGRDGMLAHTYMLGPSGQSNGCVSFKDYQAFLRAYLRGDVDRLVVVSHLGDGPVPIAAARTHRPRAPRYAANNPPYEPNPLTW